MRTPHTICIPFLPWDRASTLENWIREFNRFSPDMRIVSYYGTINERATLRREFVETQDSWDVLITTYNFAQGGGNDSKFFKKITWSVSRVFRNPLLLCLTIMIRFVSLMKDTSSKTIKVNGITL